MQTLNLPVPTSTMIASWSFNPLSVAVFRSTGKHGNKLVLPGGRVRVGKQNWLESVRAEAYEELGIKNLKDIKFFCLCSKPNRDVRNITIEKYLDGNPVPDNFPKDLQIVGHYAFDIVFCACTLDQLNPDQDEAKEAFYLNLTNHSDSELKEMFAMDHGAILCAYRNFIITGEIPALDQF